MNAVQPDTKSEADDSPEQPEESAPDFEQVESSEPDGWREKLNSAKEKFTSVLKVVAMVFGGLFLLLIGLGINQCSFAELEQMRQLERTPEVSPAVVVEGESVVSGIADVYDGQTVQAPDSGTEALYYHYEREEYDSDDGWETVETSESAVDFLLRDGDSAVVVGASAGDIEFDADEKHQREDGDIRHTEHRIDPGDEIFTFGYAVELDDTAGAAFRIDFEEHGSYFALISSGTEEEHRHGLTIWSALAVVLGVTALLFAVFLLMRVFRVHHSAAYLSVATAIVVVALGWQGLMMMVNDLQGGYEAAERTIEEGHAAIDEILVANDIEWDGDDPGELGSFHQPHYEQVLSEEEQARLTGIRKMMARSIYRTNNNRARFPEIIVAPFVGVERLEQLDLPDEEQQRVEQLEEDHQPIRLGLGYGLGAVILGLLATLGITRGALKTIGVKRTIENVPTSPVSGAVYGLTELKGTAEAHPDSGTLTSPLTKSDSVFYHYKVKKKVKRKTSKGKTRTTWKTIKNVKRQCPFVCRDETGRMLVDPDGAELSAERKNYRRRGRYRYYEWTIRPDDDVYVLGTATVNPETHDELIISDEDEDAPYIVSSLTEDELMQRKASSGFAALNVGIATTMLAGIGVAGMAVSVSPFLYWLAALVSCGYLFVVLGLMYYNDLVFLRDRVDRAWSNIDVALQKRFDLIDNLASVVQEFLDHEQQLHQKVVQARQARDEVKEHAPDSNELAAEESARNAVVARVEDHPELKGKEVVEEMMQTLREVEDDIALMRDGYNDTVERYNNRLDHIPEIFIARLCRFQRSEHLQKRQARREDAADSTS